MPRAQCNGIEIEYETFGEGTPLVLIMGLGAQMIIWPDEFCQLLAERGFRVIRFDNRDIGLSTWFDEEGIPNVQNAIRRRMLNLPIHSPYRLEDMSDDLAALLDHLNHPRAHIVGLSMGGMIAQTFAIRYPARVLSLASIMSNTGARRYLFCHPKAINVLFKKSPRERNAAIEHGVTLMRTLNGYGYTFDEARARATSARSFDRGSHPAGAARQMVAILASGNRTEALKHVEAPSVVIHGTADPLVFLSGGRATARALPNAIWKEMPGMGHNLPKDAWNTIIKSLTENTARAAL